MSCASGTIAVGEAFHTIRSGRADVMLAGGAEAPLAPMTYAAFSVIRAMSTRNDDPAHASRPFDEDRDGFVMGEGAAVLVLEERQHALARGARIYAEIAGYGCTNDAYHMTAPRPDGRQAARAMRLALDDARVTPGEVGYINAHGSSTPLNDTTETAAIKQVFGDHAYRLTVSGTKGYYGHALGASGAIEAAICALAMEHRWLPPTINLERPDPAHGVALAIVVSMTMNISGGHINPAVTTGLWIADKIGGRTALQYILAQLLGAVVGAALIKGILPEPAVTLARAGTPHLAADVTFMQGIWIEAILPFFLVSAVFGTAVSPEAPRIGGWGIGLAVFVDALVGGGLTGAAMNPARAFGPAVISVTWSGQAVYWIGPLLGAAVAAALWKAILLPRTR